jgi:hypothetical protein
LPFSVLVLKCDQGFVGYKSAGSNRLECNKAIYETIIVERADKGVVHLKGRCHFRQGDRIGRIFAYRETVYFGQLFAKSEVAQVIE